MRYMIQYHKLYTGRSIVSAIGILTQHISGDIDHILNILLPTIMSYKIYDTHFLQIVHKLIDLQNDSLLVTMHVTCNPLSDRSVYNLARNVYPPDTFGNNIQDIIYAKIFLECLERDMLRGYTLACLRSHGYIDDIVFGHIMKAIGKPYDHTSTISATSPNP